MKKTITCILLCLILILSSSITNGSEIKKGDKLLWIFRHPTSGVWVIWKATIIAYTGGEKAKCEVQAVITMDGRCAFQIFQDDNQRFRELPIKELFNCQDGKKHVKSISGKVFWKQYDCLCK